MIDPDEEPLREIKRRAADSGRTMSETVRDLLRVSLAQPTPGARRRERVKLITFSGQPEPGLQPGANLSDSADLRALLDEGDAAAWREQTGGVT